MRLFGSVLAGPYDSLTGLVIWVHSYRLGERLKVKAASCQNGWQFSAKSLLLTLTYKRDRSLVLTSESRNKLFRLLIRCAD